MPNYTTNLNLVKPLVTEQYDIAKVTNDNADIIDDAIHDLELAKQDIPTVEKNTPIDADMVVLIDSADLNKAKKLSWENIKETLKTYFDVLYQSILVSGTNIKTINGNSVLGSGNLTLEEVIIVALSDETTALTTGTAKATFRMPYACKLTTTLPRASVNTASSSGIVTVDINKNGTSILTNKLTIDANEKTSVTAATAVTLVSTPTTFASNDEITMDIDVAGTGAKGLKVALYVERT